jgi:hypothetical protein
MMAIGASPPPDPHRKTHEGKFFFMEDATRPYRPRHVCHELLDDSNVAAPENLEVQNNDKKITMVPNPVYGLCGLPEINSYELVT